MSEPDAHISNPSPSANGPDEPSSALPDRKSQRARVPIPLIAAGLVSGAAVLTWGWQAKREAEFETQTRKRLAPRPRPAPPSAADIKVG